MPETNQRASNFASSAVRQEADGTIAFPLSSEEPYGRVDGNEVLVHSPEAVDLSWLNSGNAPLLDSHIRYGGLSAQIGVIRAAWLEGKRLYVRVKFSQRSEAQAILRDVMDGIVRNVSVGYDILEVSRQQGASEYFVTKWKPTEASFVPVPADTTVGIGRAAKPKEARMPEVQHMPGVVTDEQRAEQFETALNDIRTLASSHNIRNIGESYIEAEVRAGRVPSIEVFRGIARSELPDETPLVNEDVGLTQREARQFSIIRLANSMRDGATAADVEAARFEIEACAAAGAARMGNHRLPTDIMPYWNDFEVDGVRSSAVRAPLSTSGNPNVQNTEHLSARFIDNLRDALVLGQLGVTMLPGLDGNVEIPGGDQNIVAAWLGSEDANAAESNPTFRKIMLSIKDVAVYTDMTRRMLMQSTIAIEQYVRGQILTGMAEAIDTAGWYGSGASGQPEGLANITGIGSVTFAAAVPTRNELIDMDTAIANTNQPGDVVMVTNTAMAGSLRKTKVDDGSGVFLLDGRTGNLEIGNRLRRTNQIVSGDVFAGVFSEMLMGMWGSLELDRSTEAKFLSGGLRLRAIQSVDFNVRRVGSFVLGNDG